MRLLLLLLYCVGVSQLSDPAGLTDGAEPPNSKTYFSPQQPFGIKYYFNLIVSPSPHTGHSTPLWAQPFLSACQLPRAPLSSFAGSVLCDCEQEAIDDCPEYLVHMPTLEKCASQYQCSLPAVDHTH